MPGSETWPVGAATGVGSLPGTDPREAARLVAVELPDLPHVPELPARGPGADLVGRGAALLAELHTDLQPSGWRLVSRPGLDSRRARDLLSRDLDAVEEAFAGYRGPLKCQAAGPWTLAASVELPRGDRALGDPGAVRDLVEALAEGLQRHVAELRRRVPGARVVVQLDEPSLPAVAAGRVPRASGFGELPPAGEEELLAGLRPVLAAVPDAPGGVHCCAANPPLRLLARAGAAFVSVDLAVLGSWETDAVGELVDSGAHLLAGVVPTVPSPGPPPGVREAGAPVRELWRRLSYPPGTLATSVVVTPACGLAVAEPEQARAALAQARAIGRSLLESPEER